MNPCSIRSTTAAAADGSSWCATPSTSVALQGLKATVNDAISGTDTLSAAGLTTSFRERSQATSITAHSLGCATPSAPLPLPVVSKVNAPCHVNRSRPPKAASLCSPSALEGMRPALASLNRQNVLTTGPTPSALPIPTSGSVVTLEAYDDFILGLQNNFEPEIDGEQRPNPDDMLKELASSVLRCDAVRSQCDMSGLLAEYVRSRNPFAGDDPARDLDSLFCHHFLRRSARIRAIRLRNENGTQNFQPLPMQTSTSQLLPRSTVAEPKTGLKRRASETYNSDDRPTKKQRASVKQKHPKWLENGKNLKTPAHIWGYAQPPTLQDLVQSSGPGTSTKSLLGASALSHTGVAGVPLAHATAAMADVAFSLSQVSASSPPALKKKHRRKKTTDGKTRRGPGRETNQAERLVDRVEVLGSPDFDLERDSSTGGTGWCGAAPPPEVKQRMCSLYNQEPRGRALYPYIRKFAPAEYRKCPDIRKERGTIFVDCKGQIFMYRSYRADWLMERCEEVQAAIHVLVGDGRTAQRQEDCRDLVRGPHWPIIIGHHRQSCQTPRLANWHEQHRDQVDAFVRLPIVQRIIGWVSSVVTLLFPAVAARFKADAKWHAERYGIKPLFGLFWNYCLNTWFEGQRRIHCKPHADSKNQIGVCVLLIYVLQGYDFNDEERTWLVIWEAAVAVQLPPWTLAIYPSALFYHFNIDVDEIDFVRTEGDVEVPTRQNSRPIVDGDECGRGSMVFFNQSTMRQAAAVGFDSLRQAKEQGVPITIDPKLSLQEAFQLHVTFQPMDTFSLGS